MTCSDKCAEYKDCVDCMQYKSGPLSNNTDYCIYSCQHLNFTVVKEVEVLEENSEILCQYQDENRCTYSYVYYFSNNKYYDGTDIHIRVQEEKNCPAEVYILGLMLGVIAAILLIGMAILLLWKIFTTIHDKREFARFEKERMKARWDTGENPIYKQATSTFKNPTYAGLKQ